MTISLGLGGPAAGYLPADIPPPRSLKPGFVSGALFILVEILPLPEGGAALRFVQGLLVLIGSIHFLACVHRLHEIVGLLAPVLTSPSVPYPTSAKASVWLHFVPFFNLAWLVVWPFRMGNFVNRHLRGSGMAPGLGFLLLFALLARAVDGGLSLLALFWILSSISAKIELLREQTEAVYGAPAVFE